MRAIVPFVLQVIASQLTVCQSGGGGDGGGGGPSTFGYDASSACSKPYSRAGRAHHDLPCDFRRQNWCTIAGSSYPWHAVRRFVQENQGLMRRMYGDESYISVLRAEFEKNDIELKYDEYHHHHLVDDLRQFQYDDDDYELIDDDRSKVNVDEYEGRGFTSRAFNDPIAKRLNKFSKLSEYTRPHFKPTERTTSSTVSSTASSMSSTATIFGTSFSTSPLSSSSSSSSSSRNTTTSTTTTSTTTLTNTEEISTKPSLTSTSSKPPNDTVGIVDDLVANNTMTTTTTVTTTTTTTLLPSVTNSVKEQNFSINEIPGQNDRIDDELEESAEVALQSEAATVEEDTTLEPVDTTNIPTESLIDQEEGLFDAATKTSVHEELIAASSHEQQQQFRPRPEYRPSNIAEANSKLSGQLYQDVAAKDQQEQPVLKLRGVNACPVKEEVVAPFWANNTRGEVLALLNLYPFEQYVHWEKCTHENKQMYCRDGCRCEQQYRLHRLLAYDPNNECRGIFSDWFKFPSCCVCRCYDLPLEFRVTSRSPRTSHKRRIKVQPPTRDRYA